MNHKDIDTHTQKTLQDILCECADCVYVGVCWCVQAVLCWCVDREPRGRSWDAERAAHLTDYIRRSSDSFLGCAATHMHNTPARQQTSAASCLWPIQNTHTQRQANQLQSHTRSLHDSSRSYRHLTEAFIRHITNSSGSGKALNVIVPYFAVDYTHRVHCMTEGVIQAEAPWAWGAPCSWSLPYLRVCPKVRTNAQTCTCYE